MATWDARNFLVRATLRREIVTSFADYPFSIPAIGVWTRSSSIVP
jgi:hypothetical protein